VIPPPQQLITATVEAALKSGPRTGKMTFCDALPRPDLSTATATVAFTAYSLAATDWFNGCGDGSEGSNPGESRPIRPAYGSGNGLFRRPTSGAPGSDMKTAPQPLPAS